MASQHNWDFASLLEWQWRAWTSFSVLLFAGVACDLRMPAPVRKAQAACERAREILAESAHQTATVLYLTASEVNHA